MIKKNILVVLFESDYLKLKVRGYEEKGNILEKIAEMLINFSKSKESKIFAGLCRNLHYFHQRITIDFDSGNKGSEAIFEKSSNEGLIRLPEDIDYLKQFEAMFSELIALSSKMYRIITVEKFKRLGEKPLFRGKHKGEMANNFVTLNSYCIDNNLENNDEDEYEEEDEGEIEDENLKTENCKTAEDFANSMLKAKFAFDQAVNLFMMDFLKVNESDLKDFFREIKIFTSHEHYCKYYRMYTEKAAMKFDDESYFKENLEFFNLCKEQWNLSKENLTEEQEDIPSDKKSKKLKKKKMSI